MLFPQLGVGGVEKRVRITKIYWGIRLAVDRYSQSPLPHRDSLNFDPDAGRIFRDNRKM